MNAMGTETIFKTLSDIDRYELRTTRVQQSVGGLGAIGLRLYKGSIAVLVVLAIILLSPIWYWPNITWLRVVFIINYLLVPTVSMILPLIKLARNWKPIRYYVRNPFEVLLINAKLTAEADLHHLPDLMKEALSDLEFVLLQIKAERDFLSVAAVS